MTDETVPPPVETSDDAWVAAVGILFRQFSIAVPFLIAALGFLRRHDIAGLVSWAQTDSVKPVLFALWAAIAGVWGFRKSIEQKLALLRVGRSPEVPDSVARVVPSRLMAFLEKLPSGSPVLKSLKLNSTGGSGAVGETAVPRNLTLPWSIPMGLITTLRKVLGIVAVAVAPTWNKDIADAETQAEATLVPLLGDDAKKLCADLVASDENGFVKLGKVVGDLATIAANKGIKADAMVLTVIAAKAYAQIKADAPAILEAAIETGVQVAVAAAA